MAELSSFHDVQFPVAISFGATGGPEWRNEVIGLTSGREQRNARHANSRRRFDAGTGVRSLEDVHAVLAFFEARRGTLHAFRFRDPFEMKSCPPSAAPKALDQPLGVGDGSRLRFGLAKAYGGDADAYRRPIRLPVLPSLKLAVGGTAVPAVDFSFDAATGEVVFKAPPRAGAAVTAGFEFDVPVRFNVEHLAISLVAFRAGQIPAIPLVEVLL